MSGASAARREHPRSALRARWLGRVDYREADDLQRALHERSADDHLLLLEHPHTYTLGTRADPEHVLVRPAKVGAELVHADRGGDVTYHGPGPAGRLPDRDAAAQWRDGAPDVVAHVRRLEAALIDALATSASTRTARTALRGLGRRREDRGDRRARSRGCGPGTASRSNVDPDLAMFGHIVPCGIRDRGVTSMAAVLGAAPPMRDVADAVVDALAAHLGTDAVERQDVVWQRGAART